MCSCVWAHSLYLNCSLFATFIPVSFKAFMVASWRSTIHPLYTYVHIYIHIILYTTCISNVWFALHYRWQSILITVHSDRFKVYYSILYWITYIRLHYFPFYYTMSFYILWKRFQTESSCLWLKKQGRHHHVMGLNGFDMTGIHLLHLGCVPILGLYTVGSTRHLSWQPGLNLQIIKVVDVSSRCG